MSQWWVPILHETTEFQFELFLTNSPLNSSIYEEVQDKGYPKILFPEWGHSLFPYIIATRQSHGDWVLQTTVEGWIIGFLPRKSSAYTLQPPVELGQTVCHWWMGKLGTRDVVFTKRNQRVHSICSHYPHVVSQNNPGSLSIQDGNIQSSYFYSDDDEDDDDGKEEGS